MSDERSDLWRLRPESAESVEADLFTAAEHDRREKSRRVRQAMRYRARWQAALRRAETAERQLAEKDRLLGLARAAIRRLRRWGSMSDGPFRCPCCDKDITAAVAAGVPQDKQCDNPDCPLAAFLAADAAQAGTPGDAGGED